MERINRRDVTAQKNAMEGINRGGHNSSEEHDGGNQLGNVMAQKNMVEGINWGNTTAQRISSKHTRILAVVIAILLTLFTASYMYILADNRRPLACSGTAEADLVQDIVRLVLWGVNVLLGILVFVCWCCYVWKRKVRMFLACVLPQIRRSFL